MANNYEAWNNLSKRQQLEHLCQISKADEEGKTIQMFYDGDWHDLTDPVFDRRNLYRIKPEPSQKKILPLDNSFDLVGTVIMPAYGIKKLITMQDSFGVYTGERFISYRDLQLNYTRLDGSRLEVEV